MRLHKDVQDVTVLVDRAPQILLTTLDRDEHLVEKAVPGLLRDRAAVPPRDHRRIHPQPYGAWMEQMVRNLMDPVEGCLRRARYLIHDRDPALCKKWIGP